MSTLRLGAHQLPAAEVVLIQTLMRLYSHGDGFRWSFVTAPPYDALLVDASSETGNGSEIDRMARAVLRLTRMNSGVAGPNTLERPIRSDRLQEWLKAVERDLPRAGGSPSFQDTEHVAPPGGAEVAPVSINPVRFKLRRWPPAALLRADPNRIRMATLLSRRALNAAELASISQQPVGECQAFLQTLQTTGLVEAVQPLAPDAPAAPAAAPAAAKAPAPAFARGLISAIRRRLGR